ncbi:hypothetical protein pb186bvf_016435 [Paramecium bursaria]
MQDNQAYIATDVVVINERTGQETEFVQIQEVQVGQPYIQQQQYYQETPYQQQYPPQQQFPPQQQYPPQGQVYYDNQPQVIVQPQMGRPIGVEVIQVSQYPSSAMGCRYPIVIQCPYCRQVSSTRVEYVAGGQVWCCTILLCLTIPILCWIPWVSQDCYDAKSYCGICSKEVDSFKFVHIIFKQFK